MTIRFYKICIIEKNVYFLNPNKINKRDNKEPEKPEIYEKNNFVYAHIA